MTLYPTLAVLYFTTFFFGGLCPLLSVLFSLNPVDNISLCG